MRLTSRTQKLPLRFLTVMVAAIALLGTASGARADGKPGLDLLTGSSWRLTSPAGAADLESAPIPGAPGSGTQQRIVIRQATEPYYQIQISHDIPADIAEGTDLRYRFWARSPSRNHIRAVVEQAVSPWHRVIDADVALTPSWKEYVFAAAAPAYGPGGLAARIQAGQEAGIVELSSIALEDDGLDPALKAAAAEVTPEAIARRIRKYRMADLVVTVRDGAGRPLPGSTVKITQIRHAFLFGCNIFGLRPGDESAAQKQYQDRFAALFNYATLPFYWGSFEPQQGRPQYEKLDAMAKWCADHGIVCKGHPLVYHQVYPGWASRDVGEAMKQLQQRVNDIVTHYRNRIGYWDVINEANSGAFFSPPNGVSKWLAQDGPAPVIGQALAWARSAGQGAPETFLYNDFDIEDTNVATLTQLKGRGELPDVIGIQSHMHGGVWSMPKIWVVCRRFSQFDRPIHFTETTVLSGPQRPIDYNATQSDWLTTPQDEQRQATYVAQFYSLLFSDPSVRAITWWDFSDQGAWLGAPAGMLRRDMSPKPVYDKLMDLIHKAWWSDDAATTAQNGRCQAHVYYGDYEVTVTTPAGRSSTQRIVMPEASGDRRIVIEIPN